MNPDDLEQEDDRDEFDALVASLAGPSEPEQPEPVTPEALSEPDDRAEFDSLIGSIAAQQPSAVTEPTAPAPTRPVVQQAPTVATRTGARFAQGGAELGARGGEQGSLAEAEEQARKERRRERILRGVGMGLSLVNPIIGGMISGGAGLVSTEGRRKEEILRDQLKQRGEMRAASERQRQEMLRRATEARRLQGNADRDYALRQQDLADRRADRAADNERADGFLGASRDRVDLARSRLEARRGGSPSAEAGTGPRPLRGPGGPSEIIHLPDDPNDPSAPPEAREARQRDLQEYLEQHRSTDPEWFGILRRSHPGASDYELAQQIEMHPEWGHTTGRLGRARSASIRTTTSVAAQAARQETTSDRQEAAQVRVADQRAARAQPYEDTANRAGEAAAAMERLVERLGPTGARAARGDGVIADITGAVAGADTETDQAILRDYVGDLAHERGGSALTPQEKRMVLQSVASGSFMTSPEATIRILRAIEQRTRQEAHRRRGGSQGSGAQQPAAAPAGGGAERVLGTRVINGVTWEMVQGADGRRFTRRAQ